MITTFYGLTGSGKTFLMTKLIYEEWKKDAIIYSNFALTFSPDGERVVNWSSLDELYHLNKGIIAIDEAQKLLDARRWASLPKAFADKIAMHRHHMLDIYTTTQDLGHIDVRLRSLIHKAYSCYNMVRFPPNDRIKPLFQIIRMIEKERVHNQDSDRINWVKTGRKKYYFISRLWTKKLYDTYGDIAIFNRFICKLKLDKKIWRLRIYSRDLVDRGKARL